MSEVVEVLQRGCAAPSHFLSCVLPCAHLSGCFLRNYSCASPSLVESPVSGYQQGTALAQVFALPAAQLAHGQRLNKVGHELCVERNWLHAKRLMQLVPRLSKAV